MFSHSLQTLLLLVDRLSRVDSAGFLPSCRRRRYSPSAPHDRSQAEQRQTSDNTENGYV